MGNVLNIVYILSVVSNIFPLIGGIYYYKKYKEDKVQKSFLLYAVWIIISEIFNSYLAFSRSENVWFFEVSLIIDFIYFYWFFNSWNKFQAWFKWFSISVFAVLGFLEIMRYWVLHSEKSVSYTFPILIIYFVVQCSIVIIKTFEKSDTEFNRTFVFWIAFAKLFYLMAILPFNIFQYIGRHLSTEIREVYDMSDFIVHVLANIVLNVLFMYSFKCRN